MKYLITFRNPGTSARTDPTRTVTFPYSIVDSSLVGAPEEKARTKNYYIVVSITFELETNWHLSQVSLLPVLFEYAKRHIISKIKDNNLLSAENITLSTNNCEADCPFESTRIKWHVGISIEVNIPDSPTETSVELPVAPSSVPERPENTTDIYSSTASRQESSSGNEMGRKINQIFLGCNYWNQKVKRHFELLKIKWENAYPLHVVLIDKEKGKGSKDLWKEIQNAISTSSLAIFDVSAFRPNVVLELGYCLSRTEEERIVISFDTRKKENQETNWLLSDISHLNRTCYKTLDQLNKVLDDNLRKVEIIKRIATFSKLASRETTKHDKYYEAGQTILKKMRDHGAHTFVDLHEMTKGTSIRLKTLIRLLVDSQLIYKEDGTNEKWFLQETE